MANYSKAILSGSTSGKPIPVAATATPGTLIHTAVAGSDTYDEIWLNVANVSSGAAKLTLEYGGVTDPGSHLVKQLSIPAYSSLQNVCPGLILNGGLVVRAFSDVTNALNITGFVNAIR